MVLIIAEAGVNHNGSIKLAKELVDAAKSSGADIIKFQSFLAKNLVIPGAKKGCNKDAAYSSPPTWRETEDVKFGPNDCEKSVPSWTHLKTG